jgi:thiol-disulfide isomerase/thioredoxin
MINFLKNNSLYIFIAVAVLYFVSRYLYAQPKYINGESAPDFNVPLRDGSTFQLSQLRGHYILLDFWGSWCGPCIQEVPTLKRLYDSYHNTTFSDAKGFEIVSVGIETDKVRWENAIDALQMNWQYHTSDLQNLNSPLAKQFGVRVIPTKFLLNTEGVIVGVNQSVEEIEKFLKSKMK